MTRPSDWHVLDLDRDPTPGSPVDIRAMARAFGDVADDAEYAEGRIAALMGDDAIGRWIGEGGDAFREKTGDLPEQLRKAKNSYRLASEALTWWANRLDVHQADADAALVRGRAARSDLEAAEARASAAEGRVSSASEADALQPLLPGTNPDLAPTQGQIEAARGRLATAQASLRSADADVEAARSRLDAARRLALDAAELRNSDGDEARRRINEASDAGIPERSRWDKFKDWAADAWDVIVTIAKVVVAVLGVVALIIGGPIAWVVFAAALVLLADALMKYANGEGSLVDVAWAALGAIPGTRGLTTLSRLGSMARNGGRTLRGMAVALRSGLGRRTVVQFGDNVATFRTRGGVTRSFDVRLRESFRTPRTSADRTLTTQVGHLGRTGDHGGHVVAHRFLPGAPRPNLFPQAGNLNTGPYKVMENEWADWLNHGMEVRASGSLTPPGQVRPDFINVDYQVIDPSTGRVVYESATEFANEAGQTYNRVPRSDMSDVIANQ